MKPTPGGPDSMGGIQQVQAIIDSPTRHAIIVTDLLGTIRIWNRGARRIFQHHDEDIVGRNVSVLFAADDIVHGIPDQEMADALRDGCTGAFRWHVRKDGTMFWGDGMIYPVHSRDRVHLGYVKILRDATAEKQSGDATSRLALEDSLTGLPNRTEFHKRFVDMAASAQRHQRPLILLLLDLDRFKKVNDHLGHLVGDALLQQAAHRMRAVLRDTDFLARIGGDEFVVLQPDAPSAQEGGRVAEKLVEALARPFHIDEREVHVGASIGLSVFPHDADDLQTLFKKADLALYRAKSDGRSGFRYYSAQLDASAHRHTLEHVQLRLAVKQRAFSLHYLPQVDAVTGAVLAVEALLRCSDPFFAHYPTRKLVGIAAQTGRLRRLGLWSSQHAIQQVRRWHQAGWKDLGLTLNFCPLELTDSRFAQRLLHLLEKFQLPPSLLQIDIPEAALGHDMDATQVVLLHGRGVRFAIDDLGPGQLLLKHLFDLPISAVKLDVGTLLGLPTDRRCRAKATAIIRLAQALGLQVIVEGVDCAGVAAFVRPHCPSIQGRHVAAPMSADQLTDWLAQRRRTAVEVAADVAAAAVIAVKVAAHDARDAGRP